MDKKPSSRKEQVSTIQLSTLGDLLNLNLNTLEKVVAGEIDNRKAQLIFTGSRTVTSTLKLGIEAMKLGVKKIGGVQIDAVDKKLSAPRTPI